MKNTRLKCILNGLLCLALAVTLGTAVGTTLGKYVFSGTVGTFSLNIVPRVVPAEAIMGMVPEGGTLTRIVYDYWNNGYTDSSVEPAVIIDANEWQSADDDIYDPNQPNVRMFAKQHDGTNYTVYVLSADNIYTPINASQMLSGATHGGALKDSVTEIALRNFHFPSEAKDAKGLLSGCSALQKVDLSGTNFTGVTVENAFSGCPIESVDLSDTICKNKDIFTELGDIKITLVELDLTGITTGFKNFSALFYNFKKLTAITGIAHLDIENVTDISLMFNRCSSISDETLYEFAQLLEKANNLKNVGSCFENCGKLSNTTMYTILSALEDKNAPSYNALFSACSGLSGGIDLSHLDPTHVTKLDKMFASTNITSITLFKTTNVASVQAIFSNCHALKTVDLSACDFSKVTNMKTMFAGCETMTTVFVDSNWTVNSTADGTNMFQGCEQLKGGNDTEYDSNHTDAAYARIDAEGQPGYFTAINSSENPAVVLDTTGMQNLSAELMDLGSTFAEDSKQSYGILLIPADGFLLPETFTITIGEIIYTVSTAPDAVNPDGFAWVSEDSLLRISGELLPAGGTIFVTAEAIPEAKPTIALDLSQVSNVTVFMDGTIVTDSMSLTVGAITLTLQANDGYVLPDSFTVAIGEITYTVTTADGTVTDGNSPITDITYANGVLTISPTLLSEDMSIAMNITGEKVTTDPDGEETPTEGTDTPTEGEETPTDGEEPAAA